MSRAIGRRGECACAVVVCVAVGLMAGCPSVARTPVTIKNITSADLGEQQPVCFQERGQAAPKAFVVRAEAEWKRLWGQGQEPPVINFKKSMVFCAYTSLSSEGPGTIEVWVQKFRETDELVEVQVREVVNGSFPLSAAFSRAYHIVKLPRSDKPVKVKWRYVWGTRDETKELEAKDWAPPPLNQLQGYGQGGQGGGPQLPHSAGR